MRSAIVLVVMVAGCGARSSLYDEPLPDAGVAPPLGCHDLGEVQNALGVVQIAVGAEHSCAVTSSGDVRCWGNNSLGQLGDGTNENRSVATSVVGISNAVQVAVGGGGSAAHTFALRADGTVATWGTLWASGWSPIPMSGVSDVVQVAMGNMDFCALFASGSVRCWHVDPDGPTSPHAIEGITDAVEIALGLGHACARHADGTISCWGSNGWGVLGVGDDVGYADSPVLVPGISDAIRLVSGWTHVCVQRSGGVVSCWGSNNHGQLGEILPSPPIVYTPVQVPTIECGDQVALGDEYSCRRLLDGTVLCWGNGQYYRAGLAVSEDPDALGYWNSVPTPVDGVSDALQIAAGPRHACAITVEGVACWGNNASGQLGDGTNTDSAEARLVVW